MEKVKDSGKSEEQLPTANCWRTAGDNDATDSV